jgi:hypothetical protein
LIEEANHFCFPAEVGSEYGNVNAEELCLKLPQGGLVGVAMKGQARALGGESPADPQADSARSSCDQDDFLL